MYKGERLNSISHLCGAGLGIAGMIVLVVVAARQGDPWKITSFIIYGTSLILLYTFSVLHHSLKGRAKKIFLHLDYQAIYLLIAGSYTPLTLVTLRGAWGWSLFGVLWGLALIGIVVDAFPHKNKRILPMIIYLLMGWLGLIALFPLAKALLLPGLIMLIAGGVVYTMGLIFYAMDNRMPHAHGIWHLFVLTGSIIHYFMMLMYVA